MNFYGNRCDPELAAPANRRALTPSDLEQMVDDAAGFAGQSAASAERAEEVVASIDVSLVDIDASVAQAESYAQSAQEAQEGASASSATATEQAGNAVLSAASAAGSVAAAQGYATSAQGYSTSASEYAAYAQATLDALEASKGQANGIAPLDADSSVPDGNLPQRLAATNLKQSYGAQQITVAASDTPQPYRSRADIVCTGSNDLATIQNALDQLPDNNAVSGSVYLLRGNYYDTSNATLSIGSPSSAVLNPRKVLNFERGARINVSGRTGRNAVIKVESPDCQVVNPNIAGNTSFGNGTGIAIGGDIATFGGRWDRVANRVTIHDPILSNLETGIEFASIDGGPGVGGSTGDAIVNGGYIFQNKTGIRGAGYTNSVFGTTLANNNKAIWVESRRAEAQIRCYGVTIVGWNEVGILVDGGFGSVFHDTWMEHTSSVGSTASEAIRFGQSGTVRANLTRFTGTTHVQLAGEQYAVRYVGAVDTEVENLVVSTSGTVPSVAVVRNELPSTSKGNRIRKITFGPNAIPSHTALSIDPAAWGDVFIDRVPALTGGTAFSSRINPSTRASSTPTVRKAADTSRATDVLSTDTDMSVSLAPATVYALTGLLMIDASQAADFKMQFNLSASNASMQWVGVGPSASRTDLLATTTPVSGSAATQAWGGAGAGTPVGVQISGRVTTVDLATMTLAWAQNTADATPAILKAGSWLKLEPIA